MNTGIVRYMPIIDHQRQLATRTIEENLINGLGVSPAHAKAIIRSAQHQQLRMVLEWTGMVFGVTGSLLLALHVPISGYGFVAFLISNIAWIVFGVLLNSPGLVVMQIGFTVTSVIGIWQWL